MLMNLLLVLLLSASVFSESVRETETWVPMKTTQTVAMSTHHGDLESSGDSTNGSDFGFTDDEDRVGNNDDDEDDDDYEHERVFNYDNYDNGGDSYYDDNDDDDDEDYDDYDEFSGSGDRAAPASPAAETPPSAQPDVNDNTIPEPAGPAHPVDNELDLVQNRNEIPLLKKDGDDELLSNVLMSHAGDESVFNKTEVLAALIAGGAVCLMFAVLLILLLIYRMKKKDEGSYDLGKKPIYKKAPTTEIYA